MAEDSIALSQDEIDRVLNAVRTDNRENDKADETFGVALTQDELERLFSGKSALTQEPSQKSSEPLPSKAESTQQTQEDDKALKIAQRKARMEEMLAQANASSPKRISVVYGSTLKNGAELKAVKEGGVIVLDRLTTDLAEIFVDGKLYARGKLGADSQGTAAVRITQILEPL